MNRLKLPYFEEIEIENLQDEYNTEIEFKGKEVDIFLNEMKSTDSNQLNLIKNVLENLSEYDIKNRTFITEDFDNESVTFDYLSYYLEEDYEDDFKDLIDTNDSEINNLRRLNDTLKLLTISTYIDCIVFDYCLDDEISDQLLVLKVGNNNEVSFAWES